MKFANRKTITTLITLLLVIAIAFPFINLSVVNAHYPPWTDIPTYCYVAAIPETIGVGQETLIVFWIDWIPPTSTGTYGDRWKFYLDITKPDQTKETIGPISSDPVGGAFTLYTPTQTGIYTVIARFPGQTLTGQPFAPINQPGLAYINDTFAPSTSQPTIITVQQEAIPKYQETPLPNDYWTRPIYGSNRDWYLLAANWLSGAAQQNGPTTNFGFGKAPESAHIMWSKPHWAGGIMDERFGSVGYYSGMSYESYGSPDIIINGKIFYNDLTPPRYGWWAVDLYTGETLYFHNTTGPISGIGSGFASSGAILYNHLLLVRYTTMSLETNMEAFHTYGAQLHPPPEYWMLFDAETGEYLSSIANVSSAGTAVYAKDGSIRRYNTVNLGNTANPKYYLQVWNTSQAILSAMYDTSIIGTRGNAYLMWRPILNYTFDGNKGFSLNVSISSILGPRNAILNETGTIRAVREDEYVIVGTQGLNDDRGTVQGFLRAYSLKPGQEGTTLWDIPFTPPKSAEKYLNSTYLGEAGGVSLQNVDPEDGVFTFVERYTRTRWAYSLDTGQLLWGPTASEDQFNYYGMSTSIYQGKLFSYGYSGELIAYDIKTGNILWNWSAPLYGLGETFYPNSPLSMACIADGKLYLYTTEHSPTMPLRRDAHIWCVDAETGELLWQIQHWGSVNLADGYLVGNSIIDNSIYCYGMGPSATTVSASPKVSANGDRILIEGTVTDQSPSGRYNAAGSKDFILKGTPAISDEDMEAWMEYMFHQQPKPANAKGVPVSLDTIDPNGNLVHIGNTTSDISGNYALPYTPEIPGTYQIIAMFAGSKSYGPSTATTYLTVGEAPLTPTPQPAVAQSPVEMYILGTGVAIIIAIAIAALLIIKKRP